MKRYENTIDIMKYLIITFNKYENKQITEEKFLEILDIYRNIEFALPSRRMGNILAFAIEWHFFKVVKLIVTYDFVSFDKIAWDLNGTNPVNAFDMVQKQLNLRDFEEHPIIMESQTLIMFPDSSERKKYNRNNCPKGV